MASFDELQTRFTYHPVKDGQDVKYKLIRTHALTFARLIEAQSPNCREKDIALQKLEESVMFANAAIARRT